LLGSSAHIDPSHMSAHVEVSAAVLEEADAVDVLATRFPFLERAELRRFLRACKGSIPDAEAKLLRYLQWRSETFPLRREDILEDLRRGVLVEHGKDAAGRPVLIYFGDNYKPGETNVDNIIRAMVFTLEQAFDRMPDGIDQVVLFIYTPHGASVDYSLIRALSSCFSNNYPERLHRAYVFPAGPWARGFWSLIKWCFVDAVRQKVMLVKDGESPAELDIASLPKKFGGLDEWWFHPDQV